jgi:hypothetical protein
MSTMKVGQRAGSTGNRMWMALGMAALAAGAAVAAWLLLPAGGADRAVPEVRLARTVTPSEPDAALSGSASSGRSRAAVPSLGQSEAFIREALQGLADSPAWRAWVAGGDFARRASGLLFSLSQGEVPRGLLAAFAPAGPFEVESRDGALHVTEATFARYDGVGALARTIDAQRVAAAFTVIEPVLEQAWREVAPRRLTLRAATARATSHLLAVPVPAAEVEVVEKGAVYAYADPDLERLSPAQKQLLRLGPSNQRAVQGALRDLRSALGLSAAVR